MKTLFPLALSIFLSMSAFASKCERLEYYDADDIKASYERDLVSNSWRTGFLGAKSTLYFLEAGILLVVPETTERVQAFLWSVNIKNDDAVMTLSANGMLRDFILAPTCNGISVSAEGKTSAMNTHMPVMKSDADQKFRQMQLEGTWRYSPTKKKTHVSPFTLTLNHNGTFAIQSLPDVVHSSTTGNWHVTADGQYLILQSSLFAGNNSIDVIESIGLNAVDFEDMVIAAGTLPRVLGAHKGTEQLFLEKVHDGADHTSSQPLCH